MTRALLLLAAAAALAACGDPAAAPSEPAVPAEPLPPGPILPNAPPAAPDQPKAGEPVAAPAPAEPSDDWRDYATAADAERLRLIQGAWEAALARARKEDKEKALEKLGVLADPRVMLPRPHPAPGVYQCRTVKLGGRLGLVSYNWFKCQVELTPGGDLVLRKTTGSQRPEGKLYPGVTDRQLVFVGAVAWGDDEKAAPTYGTDPERDLIGAWSRIGPERYRLALPWPRVESDLDLIEVLPAEQNPSPVEGEGGKP